MPKRRIATKRGLPDGLETRVNESLAAINAYRQELRAREMAAKLASELEAIEGPMLLDTSQPRHDRQHIKAVLDGISEHIQRRQQEPPPAPQPAKWFAQTPKQTSKAAKNRANKAARAAPTHNAQKTIQAALDAIQTALQAAMAADYGDHIITELATAMDHIEIALRPAANQRTTEAQQQLHTRTPFTSPTLGG